MDKTEDDIGFRLYTLWLCDKTMRQLKHFAVDDGVSVASMVRKLIDEYIRIRAGLDI
ncbi:hypothetical protein MKK70_11110 [Methylobacterium sp. E-041]|uniref:hypothetical protein n=1 Tax=Methylobacterium sp. E-041 TaxID=2836573 RepID=UPI001FBB003F|nr:hypothetical protein [Methylobacterium sp. E-041]MCJ2105914.1 hypothetical protein [Methylobacterium sp. E-041]